MITLFGATGYTGRRVARVLDRLGLPFRLAGRSEPRLAALAATLPSRPAHLVGDARDPASLHPLFAGARLVINCAGPFTDLGEPVAAQAAARGVHYLDITNELAYAYRLRQFDALARKTGAALVPACGFEVAIADCLAAEMARAARFDELNVVYALGAGAVSSGTRRSALRTFATSWMTYRGGRLQGQAPGTRVRRGAIGARPYAAVAFPSCEVVSVPAHCQVQAVQAWLAVSRRWADAVAGALPLISLLLRTPLGGLASLVITRVLPTPDRSDGERDRFAIQLEASRGRLTRVETCTGRDAYGLTAEIAGRAAQSLLGAGFDRAGVLPPARALDSAAFLDWLQTAGVSRAATGPAPEGPPRSEERG